MSIASKISDSMCNYLAKLYHLSQYRNTRYHKFDEIHISDLAACPIKLILNRLFEPTPPCRLLYYMREGLEWENKAIEGIKQSFPRGQAWRELTIKKRMINMDWKIVGTPDFFSTYDRAIIEIKWTRFNKWAIREIITYKTIIGEKVWSNFTYWRFSRYYYVWDSWFVQIMGYLYLAKQLFGEGGYDGYIYANRGHDISLIKVKVFDQDKHIFDFIENQIRRSAALLSYYVPKIYTPHVNLEDVFFTVLREVYCGLYKDPKLYQQVEYQCRLCPYAWLGVCPGLIPLRTFSSRRVGRLWDIEEVERIRILMGMSDALQLYIRNKDLHLYNMLINAKKEDLKDIYSYMVHYYNDSDFIADMIKAVKEDCQFAFRLRPPRTRTIRLT